MPVASSSFSLEHAQADGRRWCREVHTLTAGDPVEVYYLSPVGFDNQAAMTARVAQVNAQLVEKELAALLDADAAPKFAEATVDQVITRLREQFRSASKEELCHLAWWLLRRIAAGHITDTQCRMAFGLTATQWTDFKTNKIQPRANAWDAILTAKGE